MMSLLGRTYVVSGGLSGIGLATTVGLLKAGAHVCIADIAPTLPKELSEHSQQAKLSYHGPCDIRVREKCQSFFNTVTKERGRINGLVNCAGISPSEGAMASDQNFEEIFSLNVRGTWNLGTEAIRHMSEQTFGNSKSGRGTIVNVGSIASLVGLQSLPVYCMSKHAILGLTRAWAKDWARQGIRVNAVAPGEILCNNDALDISNV
jgi:NAD(P)-dependent dehydrogenase (short-subunit alcohol dehydrogenase family)